MPNELALSAEMIDQLCCPVCKQEIRLTNDQLVCQNLECGASFPVVDRVPVLINESNSLFSISDFQKNGNAPIQLQGGKKIVRTLQKLVPGISLNYKAKRNYLKLRSMLLSQNSSARVLVIGSGILGQGMDVLVNHSSLQIVNSDVSFSPNTMLISDAHDIAFKDETFDAVIVQAVLEHVIDPDRCADELYRVLKKGGYIYAETPFMQQVHMKEYDFTRFTHLGHRRLLRKFEEIESGACNGPASALALSFRYLLLSFTKNFVARVVLIALSSYLTFWLKYVDALLINTPGTLDAASGYYFFGQKTGQILSDRDLIKLYRGGF